MKTHCRTNQTRLEFSFSDQAVQKMFRAELLTCLAFQSSGSKAPPLFTAAKPWPNRRYQAHEADHDHRSRARHCCSRGSRERAVLRQLGPLAAAATVATGC